MADQEQPTNSFNNATVIDTFVPQTQPQSSTLISAEEEVFEPAYVYQLEDEVHRLRRALRGKQVTPEQQPPVTSTQIPVTLPSYYQHPVTQGSTVLTSVPLPTSGIFNQQIPWIPQPQAPKKVCSFKTFMTCKPSEFHGSSNPSETLDWLRDVERKFEICQCEEELKVPYASQLLKGRAMFWWDTITGPLSQQQRGSITWSDFYSLVCKQYCSNFNMNQIRRDFMNLQMKGNMSIEDLITQFTDKLRFVQHWVPDDQSQVDQFVEALPPNYRTTVRLAGSLIQAFDLARSVDKDVRAINLMDKAKGFQQSKGNSTGNKGKNQGTGNMLNRRTGSGGIFRRNPNWCDNCKSSHTGPCTPQTVRCLRCGLFGHNVKDCKYPRPVCWNCQKEGHRAGQCVETSKLGTGLVGEGSTSGQKRKTAPSATGRAFKMTVDEAVSTDDVITDSQNTQ